MGGRNDRAEKISRSLEGSVAEEDKQVIEQTEGKSRAVEFPVNRKKVVAEIDLTLEE